MRVMDSVVRENGYFKSFDEEQIYFERRGVGTPLFFCYGVGCLFNHWSPQVKYFSKFRKVYMFDYRGHHKSPIPGDKESLTIDALAQDLIELCKQQKIKKADFVGHSFGVQVLLRAYELKPDLFQSLVFINGVYHNPFSTLMKTDQLIEVINQVKKIYNQVPGVFNSLWEKGVTNPLLIPLSAVVGGFNLSKTSLKDVEIYARGIASIDIRVFITFFEQMIAYDAEPILSKIKIPTLIICGSKDNLTPIDDQEHMKELISESELYVVPYGSHCTQLDFPEMVNLKIHNWFS